MRAGGRTGVRAVGVRTGAPAAGVHVAAARVTERPWAADEYLAELQNKCLKSRNSIIQRIERSLVFKDVFAKHVGEMEDHSVIGTEIRNLRAAKHRFERTAMPAGRFTMFFDAILATANHVASHRSGRAEGDDAKAFLEMVDEKLVLAMAMIADAAHEGLQLTRFADDGDMDLAEAPARCADFARRLEVLFVKGECLSLPGFSKYAMGGLRRTKLVYCSDRVRGIGGPHHPDKKIVDELLGRFTCWTSLAIRTLRTEFPDFDILQCFHIFHLGNKTALDTGSNKNAYTCLQDDTCFAKLSQTFSVDIEELKGQFYQHFPLALRHFSQSTCNSNVQAPPV